MKSFFKGFLSLIYNSGHTPDTDVKFSFEAIRKIAAPAPLPEISALRSPLNAKGEAYEAWMSIVAAIVETKCPDIDQTELNAAQFAVNHIAFQIKESPSPEFVTLKREQFDQLLDKRFFLKEMAKHHAEKGSMCAMPYAARNIMAQNVTALFADDSIPALRAAGRRNARILTEFAEKLDRLAASQTPPPAPASPEKKSFSYQRRWCR